MAAYKSGVLRQEMHRLGHCVLTGIYSRAEVAGMRRLIDDLWCRAGCPPLVSRGRGIHPLLAHIPAFQQYLMHPRLTTALDAILADRARLMRSGARLSDARSDRTLAHWHNHFHWNPDLLRRRSEIGRVLAVTYIDGCSSELASYFMARPRRLNDELGRAPSHTDTLVAPELKSGEVLVFDSALWHSAFRGSGVGVRRIAGGHYQAAGIALAHPDDDPDLPPDREGGR